MALSADVSCRCRSKERVRLLTALFEARYAYHPPERLSAMEPSRADSVAHTAVAYLLTLLDRSTLGDDDDVDDEDAADGPRRGRKGEKCLNSNIGPIVFTAKISRVRCRSICDGDFSGG